MIKRPLSKEILFGKLKNGGVVEIDLEKDELKFNVIDIMPLPKIKEPDMVDSDNSINTAVDQE
jgi:hypothetical protein